MTVCIITILLSPCSASHVQRFTFARRGIIAKATKGASGPLPRKARDRMKLNENICCSPDIAEAIERDFAPDLAAAKYPGMGAFKK